MGFFNNEGGGVGGLETRKKKPPNPQCTPCLPSSCSLSKFLQMSYKPQTNRALMEVLTLPKAEQRARTATTAPQNDPCIPLPTPSLQPECGNRAALPTAALGGGIKTWGARERARPSFFRVLAGKGFGRRSWQAGSSRGNKKSSYRCKTERLRRRPRWLVATQPRWTLLQTSSALGLSWGLGEKALTVVIQGLYLSPFGNPLPLIDSLMFFWRDGWRCLHRIEGAVWLPSVISS